MAETKKNILTQLEEDFNKTQPSLLNNLSFWWNRPSSDNYLQQVKQDSLTAAMKFNKSANENPNGLVNNFSGDDQAKYNFFASRASDPEYLANVKRANEEITRDGIPGDYRFNTIKIGGIPFGTIVGALLNKRLFKAFPTGYQKGSISQFFKSFFDNKFSDTPAAIGDSDPETGRQFITQGNYFNPATYPWMAGYIPLRNTQDSIPFSLSNNINATKNTNKNIDLYQKNDVKNERNVKVSSFRPSASEKDFLYGKGLKNIYDVDENTPYYFGDNYTDLLRNARSHTEMDTLTPGQNVNGDYNAGSNFIGEDIATAKTGFGAFGNIISSDGIDSIKVNNKMQYYPYRWAYDLWNAEPFDKSKRGDKAGYYMSNNDEKTSDNKYLHFMDKIGLNPTVESRLPVALYDRRYFSNGLPNDAIMNASILWKHGYKQQANDLLTKMKNHVNQFGSLAFDTDAIKNVNDWSTWTSNQLAQEKQKQGTTFVMNDPLVKNPFITDGIGYIKQSQLEKYVSNILNDPKISNDKKQKVVEMFNSTNTK